MIQSAIQNLDVDVPIPRQDIYGMGKEYAFRQKYCQLMEISIDMVLRELDIKMPQKLFK